MSTTQLAADDDDDNENSDDNRSNCSVRSGFFFAERVVNVWNDLPSTVNFASLASFKRTIRDVDFSEYMRCY